MKKKQPAGPGAARISSSSKYPCRPCRKPGAADPARRFFQYPSSFPRAKVASYDGSRLDTE
jgi:hypothetical protein